MGRCFLARGNEHRPTEASSVVAKRLNDSILFHKHRSIGASPMETGNSSLGPVQRLHLAKLLRNLMFEICL